MRFFILLPVYIYLRTEASPIETIVLDHEQPSEVTTLRGLKDRIVSSLRHELRSAENDEGDEQSDHIGEEVQQLPSIRESQQEAMQLLGERVAEHQPRRRGEMETPIRFWDVLASWMSGLTEPTDTSWDASQAPETTSDLLAAMPEWQKLLMKAWAQDGSPIEQPLLPIMRRVDSIAKQLQSRVPPEVKETIINSLPERVGILDGLAIPGFKVTGLDNWLQRMQPLPDVEPFDGIAGSLQAESTDEDVRGKETFLFKKNDPPPPAAEIVVAPVAVTVPLPPKDDHHHHGLIDFFKHDHKDTNPPSYYMGLPWSPYSQGLPQGPPAYNPWIAPFPGYPADGRAGVYAPGQPLTGSFVPPAAFPAYPAGPYPAAPPYPTAPAYPASPTYSATPSYSLSPGVPTQPIYAAVSEHPKGSQTYAAVSDYARLPPYVYETRGKAHPHHLPPPPPMPWYPYPPPPPPPHVTKTTTVAPSSTTAPAATTEAVATQIVAASSDTLAQLTARLNDILAGNPLTPTPPPADPDEALKTLWTQTLMTMLRGEETMGGQQVGRVSEQLIGQLPLALRRVIAQELGLVDPIQPGETPSSVSSAASFNASGNPMDSFGVDALSGSRSQDPAFLSNFVNLGSSSVSGTTTDQPEWNLSGRGILQGLSSILTSPLPPWWANLIQQAREQHNKILADWNRNGLYPMSMGAILGIRPPVPVPVPPLTAPALPVPPVPSLPAVETLTGAALRRMETDNQTADNPTSRRLLQGVSEMLPQWRWPLVSRLSHVVGPLFDPNTNLFGPGAPPLIDRLLEPREAYTQRQTESESEGERRQVGPLGTEISRNPLLLGIALPNIGYNQLERRVENLGGLTQTFVTDIQTAVARAIAPIEDARTGLLSERDMALAQRLDRRNETLAPVREAINLAGDYITERKSGLDRMFNSTILRNVNETATRIGRLENQIANRVGFRSILGACMLNPACCEHPESCMPL